MTVRFLFWNIYKKDVSSALIEAIHTLQIDCFILCEPPTLGYQGIYSNIVQASSDYKQIVSPFRNKRFGIFSRLKSASFAIRFDENRYQILEVTSPDLQPFLLMVVHLQSARDASEESRSLGAIEAAEELRRQISQHGISPAIVVGDFNLNPHDAGIVSTRGFHSVMDKRLLRPRRVQGNTYTPYYNPMWSLLGDISNGPPGSHYFSRSEHCQQFWYMIDQVLVNESALSFFSDASTRILDRIGNKNLATADGRPNRRQFSDHFPLFFELKTL